MARPILERELNAPCLPPTGFEVATPEHDAAIRRLLRENPMPGRISLSLEREPDYFADHGQYGEDKTTIISQREDQVLCMGSCATRTRFVNGEPRRVGYLGGLRLDRDCRGRFDIVRRGYEFFREQQYADPADFYFTSILAGNEPARRLLERGLPRMPRYEPLGEFVTALMPVRRTITGNKQPLDFSPDELSDFINEQNRPLQFSVHWSRDSFFPLFSPRLEDFGVVRENGRIAAVAAVWDQRAFKQTVIRGYSPWLQKLKPLVNLRARLFGQPALPPVGTILSQAFVSHFAVRPSASTDVLRELVQQLQTIACRRRINWLVFGFAANHPRLAALRLGNHRYPSRLYRVRWPDDESTDALDQRCLAPEIALL